MKKSIVLIIAMAIMGLVLFEVSFPSEKGTLITLNDMKIKMDETTYNDLIDYGYQETDVQNGIVRFQQDNLPDIYGIIGINEFLTRTEGSIVYLGLDIDETVTEFKVNNLDLLKISKQDLAKEYDLIEINNTVRFVYLEKYLICLSYRDDKLDGFAIYCNKSGQSTVRDVGLDYRYKKWQ